MNSEKFEVTTQGMIDACTETLLKKGKDYGSDYDSLSNFKNLAVKLDLTPQQILGVFMQKHLDAVYNFIKRGQVESEPIEERLMDVINYCLLLHALNTEDNDTGNH